MKSQQYIPLGLLLACSVIVLAGCGKSEEKKPDEPKVVTVANDEPTAASTFLDKKDAGTAIGEDSREYLASFFTVLGTDVSMHVEVFSDGDLSGENGKLVFEYAAPNKARTLIQGPTESLESIATQDATYARAGQELWEKGPGRDVSQDLAEYRKVAFGLKEFLENSPGLVRFLGEQDCYGERCYVYSYLESPTKISLVKFGTQDFLLREIDVELATGERTTAVYTYTPFTISIPLPSQIAPEEDLGNNDGGVPEDGLSE